MLGTTLGIYANAFMPELINSIAYILFLITISPFLWEKGKKVLNQEKKQTIDSKDTNTNLKIEN